MDFAVSQGLIQRTVVATSNGTERRFLFTPHLGRDPFGVPSGDPSGHVRQLVGSMIYAATYADYKLSNPAAFVSRLISDGEAGDASPIGTDYPMLETGGIVRVIPGSSTGRFRLQLLQADVAEEALKILRARDSSSTTATGIGGIRDQRSYTHVERARAQLATETGSTSADEARLVAALREVTGRRSF
ncbi:MAG: hypothetical protein GC157_17420 [Frankiales bacterium]|nr:hypothetical protein [Frankiales bacterium]